MLDLGGRKVAIADALHVGVFIDGFAEIVEIVRHRGGLLDLLFRLLVVGFGQLELARRGGQADVDGGVIGLEEFGPVAPRAAVALVYDNDVEVMGG